MKGLEAQHWISAPGTVVSSEVIEGFETIPQPRVIYRFEVGEQDYTSDRIGFMMMITESRAEQIVAAYQPGERIMVHYNPASPSDSVLDRSIPLSALLTLLAGIMCISAWTWMKFSPWGARFRT